MGGLDGGCADGARGGRWVSNSPVGCSRFSVQIEHCNHPFLVSGQCAESPVEKGLKGQFWVSISGRKHPKIKFLGLRVGAEHAEKRC